MGMRFQDSSVGEAESGLSHSDVLVAVAQIRHCGFKLIHKFNRMLYVYAMY